MFELVKEALGSLKSASVVLCWVCLSFTASLMAEAGQSGPAQTQATKGPSSRVSVSDSVAADMEVAALNQAVTNNIQAIEQSAQISEKKESEHLFLLVMSGFFVGALLLIARFGPRLAAVIETRRLFPWMPAPAVAEIPASLLAEEKAFAEFAAAFRIGPRPGLKRPALEDEIPEEPNCGRPERKSGHEKTTHPALPSSKGAKQGMDCFPSNGDPAGRRDTGAPTIETPGNGGTGGERNFFEETPKRIAKLRNMLQEISRLSGELARRKIIGEMVVEASAIKAEASDPALLPAWQMASALDSLLKHLGNNGASVTDSNLRTLANALDLLGSLCVPGLNPDLLTEPPVRFLAVDDDPVSRHTVSFALKRALTAPDLGRNGEEGLALAGQHNYDAIFLDIQMPGMDGFELCSKIRAAPVNKETPIVFITCQSDFNSRAKSKLVGGCDFIGKPFLTFEITVKALTLVLRERLKGIKCETIGSLSFSVESRARSSKFQAPTSRETPISKLQES